MLATSEKLLDFFRREFQVEEQSGFARIARIPGSLVVENLAFYKSLNGPDRLSFADCLAHMAHQTYGFVVGAPKFDHTRHPFFQRWMNVHAMGEFRAWNKSVPMLRVTVQQYKIDACRGVKSNITREEFEQASSIRPVKARELRKRVRAALEPLGYYKIDELGYYCCRQNHKEFRVNVDFGSHQAQLRYCVARPEFNDIHPLSQFSFERALGLGLGNWDFIVEENVDDVFSLFANVVAYSYELPDRIRAEVT